MSTKRPPTTIVTWTASALGANFGGYDIATRPARTPIVDWSPAFEIRVPAGRNPAHIEANHVRVEDVMGGWVGPDSGRWDEGHDWAMRAIDARTGKPGPWELIASGVEVARPLLGSWVTTNQAWWLRCPVEIMQDGLAVAVDQRTFEYETAGPPGEVSTATRTRGELPTRRAGGSAFFYELTGHDQIRHLLACAHSGLPVALLRPLGDRIIGTLTVPRFGDLRVRRVGGELNMIETAQNPVPAECNLPCAAVLNGTSQYVSVGDASSLRPGTGAFTAILAGTLSSTASRVALSKGNLAGASTGYGFRTTGVANQLEVEYGAETLSETSADWFGNDVAVAVTYDGAGLLRLWRDGTVVATDAAATPGNLNSTAALILGADNGGASLFMASRPYAVATWQRDLGDDVFDASGYLLGWPGYRVPPGAAVFHDRRDQRAGATTSTRWTDLSGNLSDATLVGSPTIRGYPAPLARLERY